MNPTPRRLVCQPADVVRGHRLTYTLQIADRHYKVYFACPRIALYGGVEVSLCMAALPAMRYGLELHLGAPVSAELLANQQALMQIFCDWFPQYQLPKIHALQTQESVLEPVRRVAAFFTGGVDSFYTFLKHREEITDLIYVHGYDVSLDDLKKRQDISAMGAALEKDTGVRFIEIETNAVRVFKDHGKWGLHGHGFGLGTVLRLLQGYVHKIYIPSSFAEHELMPWGSHPLTDVLFGDRAIEVIHDGCEVGRPGKIEKIASEPMALRHLRVCWEKEQGAYNCSRCEKCLRTMTALYGHGVLSQATTFPDGLSVEGIRKLVLVGKSARTFVRENIAFLQSKNLQQDPVCQAWIRVIERPAWRSRLILRYRRLISQCRRQWRKLSAVKPTT